MKIMIKVGDKVWLRQHDREGVVKQLIVSSMGIKSYMVEFNIPTTTIVDKKDITLIEN